MLDKPLIIYAFKRLNGRAGNTASSSSFSLGLPISGSVSGDLANSLPSIKVLPYKSYAYLVDSTVDYSLSHASSAMTLTSQFV